MPGGVTSCGSCTLEVIQLEVIQLEASRWGSPPKAKLESFGESMEACWEEWAAQRLAGYCQRNLATEHVDRARFATFSTQKHVLFQFFAKQ